MSGYFEVGCSEVGRFDLKVIVVRGRNVLYGEVLTTESLELVQERVTEAYRKEFTESGSVRGFVFAAARPLVRILSH